MHWKREATIDWSLMNDERQPQIPYLTALRDELVRAAARSHDRRRHRVRTVRIGVLVLALAVAATAGFALLGTNDSTTPSADAAVLRAVRLAVTPHPGTILHEVTINTLGDLQWRYEFWQRSDAPEDARIIKGEAETSFDGNKTDSYDASTNTIREQDRKSTRLNSSH